MKLTITALLLAALIPSIAAHGMMCTPRQRAAYEAKSKCGSDLPNPSDPTTDHCPHCLNGGTVANVKKHLPPGGWKIYDPINDFKGSASRAGICGDPKGRTDHMIGGNFMPYPNVPIVAHYKTGAQVDFTAELDTNHNGYFEFYLCNLDKCGTKDISGKCFEKGHCYLLKRVKHSDCENPRPATHTECGPVDPAYPGRWYAPCRKTAHVGVHIVGGKKGTMRYQLPAGVQCKHCVIQWYWATGNSCAPRGFLEYMDKNNNPFGTTCPSDGGGFGAHRKGMAKCGGNTVPEEFWSCADIQITASGRSAGPVEAVEEPVESADPDAVSTDGEEIKEDPEAVIDKALEEVAEDISNAANETSGERKREEMQAALGECVLEDSPCDGNFPCCDATQFCVYTPGAGGFTCRYWWSLWKDAEDRQKSEKNA